VKYEQFKRVARPLAQDEADRFIKLEGMFNQPRAFIDNLEVDRVLITAKGAINKWVSLEHLRLGSDGQIYLLKKEFRDAPSEVVTDPEPAPAETEAPISETIDPLAGTVPTDPAFDPSTYDPTTFDPIKATREEGQNILIYNEWLKTQGRTDEQIVPF